MVAPSHDRNSADRASIASLAPSPNGAYRTDPKPAVRERVSRNRAAAARATPGAAITRGNCPTSGSHPVAVQAAAAKAAKNSSETGNDRTGFLARPSPACGASACALVLTVLRADRTMVRTPSASTMRTMGLASQPTPS